MAVHHDGRTATGRAGWRYKPAKENESMDLGIGAVAVFAYLGFVEWQRHQRRTMVHKERLGAIEKGLPLPPDIDPQRSSWGVQRRLLLAGLVWISVGIGAFVLISAVLSLGTAASLPRGLEWIGLAPVLIGLSHLVVYRVARSQRPDR
jgi:hypothetical protein